MKIWLYTLCFKTMSPLLIMRLDAQEHPHGKSHWKKCAKRCLWKRYRKKSLIICPLLSRLVLAYSHIQINLCLCLHFQKHLPCGDTTTHTRRLSGKIQLRLSLKLNNIQQQLQHHLFNRSSLIDMENKQLLYIIYIDYSTRLETIQVASNQIRSIF